MQSNRLTPDLCVCVELLLALYPLSVAEDPLVMESLQVVSAVL